MNKAIIFSAATVCRHILTFAAITVSARKLAYLLYMQRDDMISKFKSGGMKRMKPLQSKSKIGQNASGHGLLNGQIRR
ncbi:hypothetical protein CWP99_09235 [Salmonella enterica]|nr:hypothetical protein [Salmonella enterica subsp. salamae]EAP7916718.1 hypothetical protein [Salmonella enterica]ECC3484295.1 hypothetical protein [Salmonella enterica subsp. enterica]ESE69587.1 hypothetical protein SES60163_00884 [Salmonella enterica subsp. salamae serovar 58:l,z13,z28:z6 str. 00-0163]EBJ0942961.1 hypothetical protein [Salmonella enterica]